METAIKHTTKTRKAAVLSHVLDCIDFDAVTEYNAANNDLVTRLELVKSEFEHATNNPHNLRMFPWQKARFIDWLRGLPTVFDHEFTQQGKRDKLAEFGYSVPMNDAASDYKYMSLVYDSFCELCKSNGVLF